MPNSLSNYFFIPTKNKCFLTPRKRMHMTFSRNLATLSVVHDISFQNSSEFE